MLETITVEVRIFANLREIMGKKKFSMTIRKGSTIRELFVLIEVQFEKGNQFVEAVIDPDDPTRVRDYIKFILNGRILLQDNILDSTIDNEGDVIAIFPPIGGG
jgi:MoaD family protein